MKRTMIAVALLGLVALGLSAAFWSRLPDPMPSHFGLGGRADGFLPRWIGLTIMPALIVGLPVLVLGLARLDPRREHVERSLPALGAIVVSLGVFLLAMHGLVIRAALQPGMRLNEPLVLTLLGVLFVAMGNVMPKLRSNFFAGVRTPWTLSSEAVWHRTHRLAGWSMTAGGLLAVAAALALPSPWCVGVVVGLVLGAVMLPVVYSWWIYVPEARE